MNTRWMLTSALFSALVSTAAYGQSSVQGSGFWEGGGYRDPHWHSGYDGYGGYGGTYEGSVLHGLGSYARGVGEYNYYSALAVRELEEARTTAIKNHKLDVENWLSLRKAHQERRAAKWEDEKLTPAELAHVVKANRPERLTLAQYEPATGELTWPAALLAKEFDGERAELEEAFARRTAKDAGADSAFYGQVRQLTERMIAKLRDKNSDLSPMQLIAAKKFLVGLKYESLSPIDVKALAASD